MTKAPIDRKVLQRVRSESEQNERLLGRVITTVLSTCGTLVGWMLLSHAAQATATPPATTDVEPEVLTVADNTMDVGIQSVANPTIVPIQIDFAPIPTLPAMPDLLPVPTLMPYVAQPMSAQSAPASNPVAEAPVQAAAPAPVDNSVAVASVNDMPALRVVAQPTAPVIKVAPRPAAPQSPQAPSQSAPKPPPSSGGNSGGSN